MSKKANKVDPKTERKENTEVLAAEDELETPEVIEEAAPAPEPETKHFKDDARNAIYEKAVVVRGENKKADLEQMDDHGRVMAIRMEMEAAGRPDEEILLKLHEQGYMVIEDDELAALKAEVGDTDDKVRISGPTPEVLDTDGDVVTITVNGEQQQVNRDDALKAGISTLQKERNADIRQQELSSYEKSLKEYEVRLRENAARGLDANGNPLAPSQPERLPDDSGATPPVDVKAKVRAVREAAFNGDDEAFEESLTELITSTAGRTSLTPELNDTLVEAVAHRLDDRRQQKKAVDTVKTVNETFREDYSDLHEDDQKFRLTKTEFDRLREAEPNTDPVALMRKAGDSIRELFGGKKAADPLDDEIARRQKFKGATPPPRAAVARRPAQKPEPPPLKRSDVVAAMRRQRGLG